MVSVVEEPDFADLALPEDFAGDLETVLVFFIVLAEGLDFDPDFAVAFLSDSFFVFFVLVDLLLAGFFPLSSALA